MRPLVSICIPTFNGELYLAEAMESAINQSYTNLEIVISDDASTDETINLIEQYQSKTTIPIYIHKHKPSGIGANWNNCVKHAKGRYIKFLFQDDVLFPTCIEDMVAMAEQSSKIGLVYSRRQIIYDSNNQYSAKWVSNFSILHKSWANLKIEQGVAHGELYLKDKNLLVHPLNKIGEPTAVLIPKVCFKKVGFFSTTLQQALDIEFWYRIMRHYDLAFIDKELVNFRLHPNQASQINAKNDIENTEKRILIKKIFKSYFWYLHKQSQYTILKTLCYYKQLKRILKKLKRKVFNNHG